MAIEAICEVDLALLVTGMDPLRVLRFEASEGLSEVGHCIVEVLAPGVDSTAADFIGLDASLKLQRVRVGESIEPLGEPAFWTGIVRVVEDRGVVDDARVMEVELVPRLGLLALHKCSRFFHTMTPVEVVTDVLKTSVGYAAKDIKTGAARAALRELCTQWDESDLDFVHRLLEEEGHCYWFEHAELTQSVNLVDADRDKVFITNDLELPLMPDGQAAQADTESVRYFETSQRIVPKRVELRDWQWEAKRPAMGMATPVQGGALGFHGRVGEHVSAVRGDPGRSATRRATQLGAEAHRARGLSNALTLRPGVVFKVVKADGEVSDPYVVVRARHEGHAPEGLRGPTEAEPGDRYRNYFEAVPAAGGWRPQRVTPRARATMPQLARVLDLDGAEPAGAIALDDRARVHVEFAWPKATLQPSQVRCKVPVLQPVASSGFGFHFVPRVGSEVIVSFVDGDPERPVVMGSVYPSATPMPEAVDKLRTRSVLRTGTVGASGSNPELGHFNELSFEDLKGAEVLALRAERDIKVDALHDRIVAIGNNSTETVEVDSTYDTKGNRTETVGGESRLTVEKNLSMAIHGAASSHADNTWQITADEGLTLQCGGAATVDLKPNEIEVSAGRSMLLKVGGAKIELTTSGITLSMGASKLAITSSDIQLSAAAASVAVGPASVNVNKGALEVT